MSKTIKLVRGDDSNFLNQILLVISFKTLLNLDGYKLRFTIENPTNFIRQFEVQLNSVEINLDKVISSTLEVGEHRCNLKLIDTLDRVKTIHNFTIEIEDEFDINFEYLNEYEIEIELDKDGISKYKNYNELYNKPSINDIILEGNKTFDELGITKHINDITNTEIEKHNNDTFSHKDIRDEIRNKQDRLIAGSNITIINGIISALGENGGVTTDYKDLGNKPKINNVVLVDNLSLEELGIQEKGDYITEEKLLQKGYLTTVPSGYITEEELDAEGFLKEIPKEYFTNEENQKIYAPLEILETKQNKLIAGENINLENDLENKTTTISSILPKNVILKEDLEELDLISKAELNNALSKKQNNLLAGDNIRLYKNIDGTFTISAIDAKNPKEVASYNALTDKPTINNILLSGNKTLDDLNIQVKGNYQNKLIAGENIEISEGNIIKAIIPDDICTDIELETKLLTKADKATTLKGYNIEDAYTKDEVESLIQLFNEDKVTDIIIDAPNGVASYTETSLTIQSGLKVLFSDGLLEDYSYKNILGIVPKDITIDTSKLDYNEIYKEFYLVLIYNNGLMYSTILPKSLYKTIVAETIPSTEVGYIKNINENIIYRMVTNDSGIYTPEQVHIKIVGEGTIVPFEQEFIKISSFTPYSVYRLVNEDELLAQIKNLQPKFEVGKNFTFDKNVLEYHIPFNYVTKEFLIDNEFATFTNINDRVNIHNTNQFSHQDIRDILVKKQQRLVAGNNIILTNNSDGTQTIASTIPSSNYVTKDELRLELQKYAEITDIPDARNYVTLDKYNELIDIINDLKQQIKELTN